MTWIHCSILNGSTVALSQDDGFHTDSGPDDEGRLPVSETMLQRNFHVHVDEPLSDLMHLINPVLDDSGNIVHKFRGVIDIDSVFTSEAARSAVRNSNQSVDPVEETQTRSERIKERQAVGDPIPSTAP